MSRVFKIGDRVIYTGDGARGIILEIQENRYHVMWEDYFVSWENVESLIRDVAERK